MSLRLESPLSEELESLIYRVIGAAIEVHRHLGPGFIETIYEHALCHEMVLRGIAFDRQREIALTYKGISLPSQRLDLLIENKLILELKSVAALAPIHETQLLSYLRAADIKAGLIINFNVVQLKYGVRRLLL